MDSTLINRRKRRFFEDDGYWTAWTTTTTSLASQWGLLINIDSATGDIASTTTNTWLESNTALGLRNLITAWASNEADTAVTRTGTKTLKLSTTNATWLTTVVMLPDWLVSPITGGVENGFVVKPSTKYKLSCWVKTNNVAAASTYINFTRERNASGTIVWSNTLTNTLTWTNDWTLLTCTKTTAATAVYSSIFIVWAWVTGNTWDAWFDVNSMTLEEVIEPVANSLVTPSPSLVSFTAVGSTDNIDTSLDPTFAAANTYTPPTAISETATNKQTFTPTKSKLTRIWVYPVAKGTWNWKVTVHDASNVVQATITITNASLTNWAVNYFNVPCNLTALWTYHFHVTSTVADWTVRVATAWDLETVSYIQNYYKPTTNFKASQNNLNVSISADEDGFLNTGVYTLTNWTYSFSQTNDTSVQIGTSSYSFLPNLFSYTTTTANWTSDILLKSTTTMSLKWSQTWIVVGTYKINMTLLSSIVVTGCVRFAMAEYSYNNSSWNTINDNRGSLSEIAISQTIPASWDFVYLRFTSGNATNAAYIGSATNQFNIVGVINTSGISVLKNYPTNKDIIKQYSTTLSGATTSATYRATKWGFPAIEYSATEYQYLDVDTTATGSTVAFSELWTSYTTVADWASLAISSTSTPNIFVKANITANRIYSSSNDFNASSDKDGSLKQTLTYQVIQ